MTAVKTRQIEEATILKGCVVSSLYRAFAELADAQEHITNIEGNGSPELYDEIATAYETVRKLRDRVLAMEPTGLFEV